MRVEQTTVAVDGPVRTSRVRSASRPGLTHTVVFACSCEGFRYVGYCYHLELGALQLRALRRAWRRGERALNGGR